MSDSYAWYEMLYGPVWTVLYIIIGISIAYTAYLFFTRRVSIVILLPFILNLVFNLAFIPILVGLESNVLAFIDILFVLGTLILAMAVIFPHAKWVTYINIPHILWVSFATILQLTILFYNL